jgi:hypothetical protein
LFVFLDKHGLKALSALDIKGNGAVFHQPIKQRVMCLKPMGA